MAAHDELWALIEEYGKLRHRQGMLEEAIRRAIDATLIINSASMDERISAYRQAVSEIVFSPSPPKPPAPSVVSPPSPPLVVPEALNRTQGFIQAAIENGGRISSDQVMSWFNRRGVSVTFAEISKAAGYLRSKGRLKPSVAYGYYEVSDGTPGRIGDSNPDQSVGSDLMPT